MDLTGLQGDAEYEVRIRAMNHQGWSQLSDPFYFKTSGMLRELDGKLLYIPIILIIDESASFVRLNILL